MKNPRNVGADAGTRPEGLDADQGAVAGDLVIDEHREDLVILAEVVLGHEERICEELVHGLLLDDDLHDVAGAVADLEGLERAGQVCPLEVLEEASGLLGAQAPVGALAGAAVVVELEVVVEGLGDIADDESGLGHCGAPCARDHPGGLDEVLR